MEVENIAKAATFKCFFRLSYKNTQLLIDWLIFFFWLLFNIFMRQTLTGDFWGLHKNMNCAFPLSRFSVSLKSLDNYFFRWFAYKSLLSRFSVLINYNMSSSNHFSTSSYFPRFSGSRFFRVQTFFRVQVFLGPDFF